MHTILLRYGLLGLFYWITAFLQVAMADESIILVKGLSDDPILQTAVEKQVNSIKTKSTDNADLYQKMVKSVLETYGYFQPTISLQWIQRSRQKILTLVIRRGKEARLRSISIRLKGSGRDHTILSDYLNHSPIKVGDRLVVQTYQTFKMGLLDLAQAHGYRDAVFEQVKLVIDRVRHTADIDWVLDTGNPYYFGSIDFSKTLFSEDLLKRFLPFSSGQVFDRNQLLVAQENLEAGRYFQTVQVNTDLSLKNKDKIPVHIELTPLKQQQYSASLGYSSDVGIRGALNADWRYINSMGHRLGLQLKGSTVRQGIDTRYTLPGFYPTTDSYLLSGRLLREQLNSGRMLGGQLSAGYLRRQKIWQQDYQLAALYSKNDNFNQETTYSLLVYPRFAWRWIHHPEKGSRYAADLILLGSKENVLSNLSFFQWQTGLQWRWPLSYYIHWVGRARFAYSSTEDLRLPLTLRLYVGGTDDLRGYAYQSIPGKGQPLARYLLTGSFEWHQRLYDAWFLTGYVDAGNATTQWPRNFKKDLGIGISRDTPLGSLHISLAKPILDPLKKSVRLVVSFGTDI